MNKDHIIHLPGFLDRVSCQSLIDIFESLDEYHEDGKVGTYEVNYNLKKCTETQFNFLSSEVGLSVTTTNEGLLEEALINPHEPSSKENLTLFTVKTSLIS